MNLFVRIASSFALVLVGFTAPAQSVLTSWWQSTTQLFALEPDPANNRVFVQTSEEGDLIALDLVTGQPTGFVVTCFGGAIFDMELVGSTLYLGGNFVTVGGLSRSNLAAVNVNTGAVLPWNPGASPSVFSLASDGTYIYAGGMFSTVGGQSHTRLAKIHAGTGAVSATWAPAANGDVWDIEVSGGTVYASGLFTTINGTARNKAAAMDAATGALLGWDPQIVDFPGQNVSDLEVAGSDVLICGGFTSVGGQSRAVIAKVDATTAAVSSWNPGQCCGAIYDMTVDGNDVFVGGSFTTIGGQSRTNIARISLTTPIAVDMSWPSGSDFGQFSDIAVLPSVVLYTGAFNTIGGTARVGFAAISRCASPTVYADADGDGLGDPNVTVFSCVPLPGYVLNNADCDDTDPLVNGPTPWYADNDGDGWGTPPMILACSPCPGCVENDIDCDDTDPDSAPTEWCVDVDTDGHGNAGITIWSCGQPLGTVPVGGLCDDCDDDNAFLYPGAPCDDGDPGTIHDVIQAECACVGVPCTDMSFELLTDGNGAQTSWEVHDAGTLQVSMSGAGYGNNSTCVQEDGCVPGGPQVLQVFDSGTGMSGSYLLRAEDGGRVVHNSDGFTGSMAQHGANGQFTTDMGTDRLTEQSCDANGVTTTGYVRAATNAMVVAQVVPPGTWSLQPSNTGYEFWFFNPDGGYNKTVFQNLRAQNAQGGADANARYLPLNSTLFNPNPLPLNTLLNVRIRGKVAGVPTGPWGPACRILVNGTVDAYWQTHLVDLPGDPAHACGAVINFDEFDPVNVVNAVRRAGSLAYHVAFRWERVSDGHWFEVQRTSGSSTNNRWMALSKDPEPGSMANWPAGEANPLPGEVYSVRVRTRKAGTSTWSAYGHCCLVTIGTTGAMAPQPEIRTELAVPKMEVWPNPTTYRQLNLAFSGTESTGGIVHVQFTNVMGHLIMERDMAMPDGATSLRMELPGGLATGVYSVRTTWGEHQFVERLFIQ